MNLAPRRVEQDKTPPRFSPKSSETFTTCFLPVDDEIRRTVTEQITFLRQGTLWGDGHPLFPAT